MGKIYTLPDKERIEGAAGHVPMYMRPCLEPTIVVWEEALTKEECEEIVELGSKIFPHSVHRCNAETREIPFVALNGLDIFKKILNWTRATNGMYWNYKIDDNAMAWMQTYYGNSDGAYSLHRDAAVGQRRKLTTVVILSDPNEYLGGELIFKATPGEEEYKPKQLRGTLVTFPFWLLHEVTPLRMGIRRSLNVGFWGDRGD